MTDEYIHGFTRDERERLSRMQDLLNDGELELLRLGPDERVLEVGAGLGQMARAMARGSRRTVVGVERDESQLAAARALAEAEGEAGLVELRAGDATALPLGDGEAGTFDLAHARFVLEHVRDPEAVVREMVRAVRPGGRVALLDDDHELLRTSPTLPELERAWTLYQESYRDLGCDPLVGRRLPELLVAAGARSVRVTTLFYGAVRGMPNFDLVVRNLVEVLEGAADALDASGRLARADLELALERFREWSRIDGACVWYSLPFAEGVRSD